MKKALKAIAALGFAVAAPALPVNAEPAQAIVTPVAPPAAAPTAPACAPKPEWDTAVLQNPQDSNAHLKRGQAYASNKEHDCAIADFSAALALMPADSIENVSALTLRSRSYQAKGNVDLALADLSEAIRMAPDHADLYVNRGSLLVSKGNFSEATGDFSQALMLDPQNTQALLGRGMIFARQGNSSSAIAEFNHALEIDPGLAAAYHNLGLVYASSGDTAQATSYFSRAIDIDPGLWEAFLNRGNIYMANNHLNEAIADYTHGLALNPGVAALYTSRGVAYRARGDLAQAVQDLQRATALDPKNAAGFYNLGLTRYFTKKYGDALKAFAKSADLTTNPNAKFYPAFWAYAAKAKLGFNGKTILSRVTAQMDPAVWPAPIAAVFQGSLPANELLAKIPSGDAQKQPNLSCEAYFYLGEWHLMNGQQDQATSAFKAALSQRGVHSAEAEAARLELQALGETVD